LPLFSRLFNVWMAIFVSLLWLAPSLTYAQPLEGKTISDIKVEGNRTVGGQEILDRLKVQPGDRVEDVRLLMDRDLKELWKTGKFKDVQMSLVSLSDDTVRLLIDVQEKPILRSLKVTDGKSLPENEILDKSGLKTGTPYDEYTATQAAEKIRAYYKEKEFYQAKVTPEAEVKGNEVTLVFKVNEGMKIKVTKITVSGNQAFSESKVKGFMETKEAGWFVGGTYKEETFKEDLKKILSF